MSVGRGEGNYFRINYRKVALCKYNAARKCIYAHNSVGLWLRTLHPGVLGTPVSVLVYKFPLKPRCLLPSSVEGLHAHVHLPPGYS